MEIRGKSPAVSKGKACDVGGCVFLRSFLSIQKKHENGV